MGLTPDQLRIALLTRIEFGPETRRRISERLAERLPALKPSERVTALDAAHQVVSVAERLVREFRAGQRTEDTITGALVESFPWLGADAAPVQSPAALPAQDLSSRVRTFAYYLVMT
jgi:hypothetical protein